ncbi:M20 family metallopeptidase [Shimazuella kribbensis]|uniref:M20 family metallopeptidase n=1 Tax=Shimazuella kribbensis TaxID=139808 RepID=UPI00048AFCDD|nr:M20 family metallopeptidase [Shimazuella kribbensis]
MDKIFEYMHIHRGDILSDLELLVKSESPSFDKKQVDLCGDILQFLIRKHLGVQPDVILQEGTGNHLRSVYGQGEEQILILTHFDTVWDVGRLSYRMEGNKAFGPGILDMKSGIIQAIWAIKACKELDMPLNKKIVLMCTSDEEIGSHTSRSLIEQEAKNSKVTLVPEPAVTQTGALKTGRKGTSVYKMTITGKASHAGNHHADGISAVEEMAHQILFLQSLTDYEKGTTVNAGIANGGNRINVVAEKAEIHIDVRMSNLLEAKRISHMIHQAKPHLKGITLEIEGGVNRPPMERTRQTEELFHVAKECGDELGLTLTEAFVGGGSDGNFTAALGIPTLDGLGAIGDGIHAEHEHILIDQLPVRAALFAKLITKL